MFPEGNLHSVSIMEKYKDIHVVVMWGNTEELSKQASVFPVELVGASFGTGLTPNFCLVCFL